MTDKRHGRLLADLWAGVFDDGTPRSNTLSSSRVTARTVQLWANFIDATQLPGLVEEWRNEDRAGKRPGGPTPRITDRTILIISMILLSEGSNLWVKSMREVLQYRLTKRARGLLDISDLFSDGARHDWYMLAWRATHRMIDTWDAWPAPRRLLLLDERRGIEKLRDQNTIRIKEQRSTLFINTLLESTVAELPAEFQRRSIALSIDQSSVRAPSQSSRWRRDRVTGEETPKYNKRTGEEVPRPVMELEAALYPLDKGAKVKNSDETQSQPSPHDWELSYMANIAIDVLENPEDHRLTSPQLIRAASLGRPNHEIGRHTVELIDSLQGRGYRISRLSVDRGYSGNLPVGQFHRPMRERGVDLVMDLKKEQKGINGEVGGALQVEGNHYCPATPKNLLTASERVDAREIDPPTYYKQIDERGLYVLHAKERPDASGAQRMQCPALGPSATVTCPLRSLHADASPDKDRAQVLKQNLPKHHDKVCTQSSITVRATDGEKNRQKYRYGTAEWQAIYRRDRNSIESINRHLKDEERLRETNTRRLRGLASQQYLFAMIVTASNLRKIVRFITDRDLHRQRGRSIEGDVKTQRRRDREGWSNYKRWPSLDETTSIPPGP